MASMVTIKSGYRPTGQLSIASYKEKSHIYKSPFDIAHRRDSKSDFMQHKEKVNFTLTISKVRK